MSEVEKQESQKTVVAFITGLLIGGLLVWVFSDSSEEKKMPTEKTNEAKEETVIKGEQKQEISSTEKKEVSKIEIGDGSVTVEDQKPGKTVALKEVKLPTKNGWIVVRDFMDGIPANILGAARFSSEDGLIPTSVELMRETTEGSTYQVSFYTNEGDVGFNISEDKMIEGIATTFKAN